MKIHHIHLGAIASTFGMAAITAYSGLHPLSPSACHMQNGLPDALCTPGAINTDITQDNIKENICNPHWTTRSIRPSSSYTTGLKIQQIKAYGYTDERTSPYEEDHLISLELGGSPTDPKNLWPQPYTGVFGAHAKDKVENELHMEVCNGEISLKQAQQEISKDWEAILKQGINNNESTTDN